MSFLGKVIPDQGLRVRSGPGIEHAILGVLEKDQQIVLSEMIGEWWRVESPFGPGFVHSAFIAPVPVDEQPEQPEHPALEEESATEREEESYTCVSGDTLFRIGTRFSISFTEIAVFNGLVEPFTIRVGQVLRIPRRGGPIRPVLPVVTTISILNPFVVSGETEVTSSSLQGHHMPWLGACSCDLDVRGVGSPGTAVHFNVAAPAGVELRGKVDSVGLACRSQLLSDGGHTVKVNIEKRQSGGTWTDTRAWLLYAHLDPVVVSRRDIVMPGSRISALGPATGGEYNSSCAQGSHVHMEATGARCVVNQQSVIRDAAVMVLDA